jgi:hypothetical protein
MPVRCAQVTSQLGVCLGNGDGTFRDGILRSTDTPLSSLVGMFVNNDNVLVSSSLRIRRKYFVSVCSWLRSAITAAMLGRNCGMCTLLVESEVMAAS